MNKNRYLMLAFLIVFVVLIAGCTIERKPARRMYVSIINQEHKVFTKESNDTWYRLTCDAINHGDPGYVSIRAEADDNLGRSLGKSEDKRIHLDTNETISLVFEFDIEDIEYKDGEFGYIWHGDETPD